MKLKYSNGTDVDLDSSSIAWPADSSVYVNGPNKDKQCIDNDDQNWLVWFRPAARKDWFKLKAKITDELEVGDYTFETSDGNNSLI